MTVVQQELAKDISEADSSSASSITPGFVAG